MTLAMLYIFIKSQTLSLYILIVKSFSFSWPSSASFSHVSQATQKCLQVFSLSSIHNPIKWSQLTAEHLWFNQFHMQKPLSRQTLLTIENSLSTRIHTRIMVVWRVTGCGVRVFFGSRRHKAIKRHSKRPYRSGSGLPLTFIWPKATAESQKPRQHQQQQQH